MRWIFRILQADWSINNSAGRSILSGHAEFRGAKTYDRKSCLRADRLPALVVFDCVLGKRRDFSRPEPGRLRCCTARARSAAKCRLPAGIPRSRCSACGLSSAGTFVSCSPGKRFAARHARATLQPRAPARNRRLRRASRRSVQQQPRQRLRAGLGTDPPTLLDLRSAEQLDLSARSGPRGIRAVSVLHDQRPVRFLHEIAARVRQKEKGKRKKCHSFHLFSVCLLTFSFCLSTFSLRRRWLAGPRIQPANRRFA